MSFGAPAYLWFLLLVPASAAMYAAWVAWRAGARRRFGSAISDAAWPYAVAAMLVVAAAFAAFAAARPQFGERETRVEQHGIDLVIALDISQSMFATDVEPTRLRRAQDEIIALLDRSQGDRVGLVVFAGRPFVRSPLTGDTAALARLVEGVDRELGLVPPGSDVGSAIREGVELLEGGEAEARALVVISDGEDHTDLVAGAIRDATAAGVTVYTAGVGTAQGSAVMDRDPETLELRPRRDDSGQPVVTRLDAAALRSIATVGGGRYVELSGDGRPLTGLAPDFDSLAATTFDVQEQSEPIERFQVFTAIALALVVAASIVPVAVTQRREAGSPRPGWRCLWPLGAAGLFIGAMCASEVATLNREANLDYAQGRYDEALSGYRTAQAIDPSHKELFHNAGNALNKKGEYALAAEETKKGLPADDDELAALLEYAIGNHYAGGQRLNEALEAFKRSLIENPEDEDAKHNLEVIQWLLDRSPTPSPTPAVPPPEVTPTVQPGDDEGGGGTQGEGQSTPQPGEQGDSTPGAEGTPGPGDREMTPQEIQRALEDALRGIDEEFTVEEALRVLELLEQRNRSQLQQPSGGGGGAPDY